MNLNKYNCSAVLSYRAIHITICGCVSLGLILISMVRCTYVQFLWTYS